MNIEVQTTQNVTIDYETAGVGPRILAYLIDWVVIIVWVVGWVWILSLMSNIGIDQAFSGSAFDIFIYMLVLFPVWFYDLLLETMNNGQSLGKMALKLRVVNVDGTVPSTGSFLIRWLFRLVDFPLSQWFLGVIMVAVTKKSQRLGDVLAGTTVITMRLNARNRGLSITDLDFHEDYKVTYADVLDRLSDKDIQTVMSIIDDMRMRDNLYFNKRLADRIKTITGYTYDGPDAVFLRKLIADYNYLAIKE